MTVEVKVEETQMAEAVVAQEDTKKDVEESQNVASGEEKEVDDSKPKIVEKSASYKEESNFFSDLKEFERKALNELKSKLEEAILGNNLFKKEEPKKNEKQSSENVEKEKEEERKKGESETPIEEEATKTEPEGEKKPEEKGTEVDRDISLWGAPLLPSKCAEATDVVLLKFLRAREFKVNEAFEMLKKTMQWRKDFNIDSILDENLGADLSSVAYMNGVDREGHPVCYNIYGVFENEELYQKTFGTEEKREQFLRWRFQLMEKGIQKLDLRPSGVSSLLQINDLKNSPGLSKKELRIAMKQAVSALQDNYPEFVARNVSFFSHLHFLLLYAKFTCMFILVTDVVFANLIVDICQCSILVLCPQCPVISFPDTKDQEQICGCSSGQGHRNSSQVSI